MDYNTEVEKDAYAFLSDIEDDIKAAILNGEEDVSEIECEESGYGDIRDFFHEQITDRSYSIEDAAYVIANCEEEETDSGMWEGQEMYQAMQTCAAFSYGNDVWAKVAEIYEEMFEEFEPDHVVIDEDGNEKARFPEEDDAQGFIDDYAPPEDRDVLEIEEGRGNIDEIWQEYEDENVESEIETGGAEELQVLRQWVRLCEKAGMWGGYPFGSVYIDARCGTGYSMPDVKDFTDFDIIARRKLPSMTGSYADAVKARIEELEGNTRKPYRVTVELEGDQWGEIITGLHGIATKIADGHGGGAGWKLTIPAEG
jgi:hypothetical protein